MNPDLNDNLLTLTEAARVLRVSRTTLYKLVSGRKLATMKIESRRSVRVQDVKRLIGACVQEGL